MLAISATRPCLPSVVRPEHGQQLRVESCEAVTAQYYIQFFRSRAAAACLPHPTSIAPRFNHTLRYVFALLGGWKVSGPPRMNAHGSAEVSPARCRSVAQLRRVSWTCQERKDVRARPSAITRSSPVPRSGAHAGMGHVPFLVHPPEARHHQVAHRAQL